MRKALVSLALLGLLIVPSAAEAAFPANAFNGAVNCTLAPNSPPVAGQRWCTGSPSTVPSFDGAPIDVAFYAPPAPASGPDGNFPVIGVYHGYGGVKYGPTSSDVQRWMSRGYAVFTMTDRGFRASCGVGGGAGSGPCVNGYVHLLSSQWEVRDAQFFLGLLADDNSIAAKQIGAVGQSYGSGMSILLGALKNRIQRGALTGEPNTTAPWTSPAGKAMEIAATAPEFGWSDLSYSLVPNGSTLDYAALNPYRGPAGQPRRAGVEKAAWTESLFFGGLQAPANGFYCGAGGPCNDSRYDLPAIRGALTGNNALAPDLSTPSPAYDGNTVIQNALDELSNFHSAYGTDDSVAPAPAILSNGWNDDLFPVDEAVRYYNKVRQNHPTAAINLWAFDWGHPTRTAINLDNALSLFSAEGRWMDFYVRGIGSAPEDPSGGVNTISSGCSDETTSATPTASAIVHSKSWADLTNGEITITGAAAQAITATNTSANTFQAFPTSAGTPPTVCTTSANTDTTGAATYTVPAEAADYTIAGSPTMKFELTTGNVNDTLLARLYDVNPAGSGSRRLIARGALRPYGTNPGSNVQVFQLHPQQWKVVAGHTLKLELMAQDSPYARRAAGQSAMSVKDMELRVPTLTAPAGSIKAPAAKVLPPGYTLARDFVTPTPTASPTAAPTYVIPTPTPTPTPYVVKPKPRLTAKARPKRDRRKPFVFRVQGKLVAPGVSKDDACKGIVRVVAKKGGKVVGKRRVGVKSSCKYKARLKLRKAGRRGTVKFNVTYLGSDALLKATAKTSAKYGRKGK